MAPVEPTSLPNVSSATPARPLVADVSPVPTDDEIAAIAAAVDALWPRAPADESASRRPSAWRFSGRWWSQPIPLRRGRPWT